MKTISPAILIVLLLVTSALAQNPQNASPEMQMPSGAEPSAQTHTHAKPEHSAMEGMEMHTPESTASHVASVQEPEKPSQRTGSNTPVPDLLQQAQEMPPKRLADFEVLALKNNPTLKQAQLMTKADAGLAHQAGLWPNPAVGYQGDEIRGGVFRGGEQGGFVQQNIVLGGKLGLRRKVYEQQQRADQLAVEEQKLDVRGAVEVHFYSALALLRRIAVLRELLGIAMDAATTAHQLANVGQADAPDVLQAEVEAEQAKLEFVRAERDYIQSYQQLAAIAGDPQMPLSIVDGDLENPPLIDSEKYLQDLVGNSPTLKRAQQEANRAAAALARDKRESIPDLFLRAGLQQDLEVNEFSGSPVGLIGFATAGVQIPLFNRNQGNVQAARANLENAEQEVARVRLVMLQTAQPLLQRYLTSRLAAERYSKEIIPRAQRAYELYLLKYRNMAGAYPEVLVSQRTLFQAKDAYIRTLGEIWTTSVQLQNYLLADGLSAPTPSGSMSTQINLPTNTAGGPE